MFGIENYSGFVMAIVAFQLIPGPGTLIILNATAREGIRDGMQAVAGTLAGDALYMTAAVLGLAAVLAAHPAILSSLRWLGIAYLVWLGIKLLFSRAEHEPQTLVRTSTRREWLRRAFAVSLTNPKVIMFFMAFFPLFLGAGARPLTLLVMMAHVSLLSLIYQSGLVLVGNAIAVRLSRNEGAAVMARRLVGFGLIGFGVKLAVNRR